MQEMFYMCQKSEVQVKNGNVKLLKWLISFQLCSKMLGKKKTIPFAPVSWASEIY